MTDIPTISFRVLIQKVKRFGFMPVRQKGSHIRFVHPEVSDLLNLQNIKGKAKPYQLKQLLRIVEKHNLYMESSE